jgi:hypothetical protein
MPSKSEPKTRLKDQIITRTPEGWLSVPRGVRSGCKVGAHRGSCAFDGTEQDRCPGCHALWAVVETWTDYEGSHELHVARHRHVWAVESAQHKKRRP